MPEHLTTATYPKLQALTADATLANVGWTVAKVDATAGNVTVTLPAVAAGRRVTVKRTDGSANTVTVSGGATTIDGAASAAVAAQWDVLHLVSDGTNWLVV